MKKGVYSYECLHLKIRDISDNLTMYIKNKMNPKLANTKLKKRITVKSRGLLGNILKIYSPVNWETQKKYINF